MRSTAILSAHLQEFKAWMNMTNTDGRWPAGQMAYLVEKHGLAGALLSKPEAGMMALPAAEPLAT